MGFSVNQFTFGFLCIWLLILSMLSWYLSEIRQYHWDIVRCTAHLQAARESQITDHLSMLTSNSVSTRKICNFTGSFGKLFEKQNKKKQQTKKQKKNKQTNKQKKIFEGISTYQQAACLHFNDLAHNSTWAHTLLHTLYQINRH